MNKPLRVALVTSYPADPARFAGGLQAVAVRLVAELRTAPDIDLHVIHCHSDITESRVVRDGPVTIHYLAQTRRRLIPNMATGVARIAAELRWLAPDVVHAHFPSFVVAALQAGYRPIWTIHGVLAEEAQLYRGIFHRLSYALARQYERRALAEVATITAVSRYVLEAYRGRSKATWHVIENPAPADLYTLPRQPVAGRVLMAASVIPLKDPLTLVRAAAQACDRVPNLSVHLAGSLMDNTYATEVRAAIGRLGLGERVTLLGALDTATLRQAYSQAAVVALPSRQEVAPMAVIEAMAAGIPVIASTAGGLPFLVEEGVTGRLIAAGADAAWADALVALLTDTPTAERMGATARQIARTRFDPTRIAQQYLALYHGGEPQRGLSDVAH